MSFPTKGVILAGSLLFLFPAAGFAEGFNAERAYRYLQDQCMLGTREPLSPGHAAMKKYLEDFLKKQKGRTLRQDFSFQDTQRRTTLALTNFRIVFDGKGGRRILLCAHWDTRPWADEERDPARRKLPIPGANDAGSGVAVLMELCNVLSARPPGKSVEIVFFDGEDYGTGGDGNWCLGSKYFAGSIKPSDYSFGVLLDMVGDRDLKFRLEGHSLERSPLLLERLWRKAENLNLPAFSREKGPFIYDDHVPLLEKGIPVVDIIDFDYPYWHTLEDTPGKCSAGSLAQTGGLMTEVIYGADE